ncbi:MAG: PhoH family protein [Rhodospirillaceae bacterium]|jgi:phosphate starvation-inducible PhoH-like protein|nr:PhoH family protein [Rhodospirillaceae bacterium]
MDFDDNSLLSELYGEHDRNLARIEQRLNVSLSTRGNRLAVSGTESAQAAARTVLEDLYARLKKGYAMGNGEVDAAIRMAEANTTGRGPKLSVASDEFMLKTPRRSLTPRSPKQAEYIENLRTSELTFGLGPAGTGKTFLAVAVAIEALMDGSVQRIILSRPAVEAGERLGFLPGDMRDKIDPYLRPLYDALNYMMPGDQVIRLQESGEIEIAPVAFMRGRTLTNAWIIVDEAQNTTTVQMKMLLTRLGEGSRMAINGDLSQIDLPRGTRSGLANAADVLRHEKGIKFTRFGEKDIVRHDLVARIVHAYDSFDKAHNIRNRDGAEEGPPNQEVDGKDDA